MQQAPKESLADVAYRHTKQLILSATLLPDSVIDEKRVAADLCMSRTPVRQATSRLAAEGFVRVLPQRGTLVARLSVSDIEQVYLLRSLVEPTAASLAARRATSQDIEHLEACERTYLAEFEIDDHTPDYALHARLHVAIAEVAGMSRLTRIVRELQEQTQWFLAVRLREGRQVPSPHSHQVLLEAIKAGDPEAARDNARTAILGSRSKILAGIVPNADLLLGASAPRPFAQFSGS